LFYYDKKNSTKRIGENAKSITNAEAIIDEKTKIKNQTKINNQTILAILKIMCSN
jgi:hypothetical protein